MNPAEAVSNTVVDQLQQDARAAWARKDFEQGIKALELVSRLAPANGMVLLQLGHYHGLRYDYAAAERCFDQAIRLARGKSGAMAYAGELATHFVSLALAERYFNQATRQKDASADICVRLAELYDRLSRPAEARELLGRALHLDPACTAAAIVCARLDRQSGRLEDAERTLQGALTNAKREARVYAFYELGKVLDRLNRFDEAMAAFLAAKELLRPETLPWLPQLQRYRALIREQQTRCTRQNLQRWFDFGSQFQPARRLAFLGGHSRSGTTLLEQVLDSHPDIICAGETPVFTDEVLGPLKALPPGEPPLLAALEAASVGDLRESRSNYFRYMEKLLDSSLGGRLLIDKNPALTAFLPAYLRIFPEIKILMSVRDPRDVALSCFMQTYLPITLGSAAYQSLEETVNGCILIMGGWKAAAPLLQNPWLEVRYEDTVHDLPAVSRRVIDFLGVPWNAGVLEFYKHAQQKHVRSPTYEDVTRPIFKHAVGRWRNYQKYFEPYLHKLEPLVKAFGYD